MPEDIIQAALATATYPVDELPEDRLDQIVAAGLASSRREARGLTIREEHRGDGWVIFRTGKFRVAGLRRHEVIVAETGIAAMCRHLSRWCAAH